MALSSTTPVPPPQPGSVHLNSTLGALTAIGGAMGYFKKGSVPSLMAGSICGALLIGSGVLITKNEPFQGHALASGVTGFMTISMGQRYISTGKFMPAGVVATLGAAGLAYNVRKTIELFPEYY
jgi:uncharacterized membrane protein (UPF0136 family)